jgi:hypothetical protein
VRSIKDFAMPLACCMTLLAVGCQSSDNEQSELETAELGETSAEPPSVPVVSQVGDSAALELTWSGANSGFIAVDRRYPGCGGYCYEGNKFWSNDPVFTWTDTDVEYGIKYGYKVWNKAGQSAYSDEVAAAPRSEPPAVTNGPLSLPTVTQVGDTKALKLVWTGGNGGFVAIDRRYPGCGSYCYEGNIHWSNEPINAWTDTNVEYGVQYGYKVWNSDGNAGYSDELAAVEPGTSQGTGLPPGTWELSWSDEFEAPANTPASSHWMTYPAWAEGPRPGDHYWRDAVNSPSECYHDGDGNLVLRTRYVDGERRACYLTTGGNGYDVSQWTTFGPGTQGTYIEFRANISRMRAFASWFAMWLMSPNDTYDGEPSTGSEIDVMEYIPFTGPQYSLENLFHSAVWWEQPEGISEPPPGGPVDAWHQLDATWFGADLTEDGYHTWGVEWYGDLQRFYFDGTPYWTNQVGVSGADNHTIRLSIEIQNGNPYNLWGHPVGAFEDNDSARLPSYARVDYVRVYTKQ